MPPVLAYLIMVGGLLPTPQAHIPRQWRLLEAIEAYRAGDTPAALKMLAEHDLETQRETAEVIIKTHRIETGGTAPPALTVGPTWTLATLRAAGALHMEAALDAYARGRPDVVAPILTQVQIGELFLDEVARLEKQPSDAVRWGWAIGQTALSDGAFYLARQVLFHACDRYPGQIALLIACGTVHETYATLNATDALRAAGSTSGSGIARDPAAVAFMRARKARTDNLRQARRAFEEALEIEGSDPEAALRLGRTRLEERNADAAATVLEPLVRNGSDRRVRYLARLFLGRTYERQQRFDEAGALFGEATAILPAQSARLALANRMHAGGNAAEAARLAEQVTEDTVIEDPWWGYRFGQFWLLEEKLVTLRAEARQ